MVIAAQNIQQKPGYKQTEVGLIPEDWEVRRIGDVVTDFRGGAPLTPSDFIRDGVRVLPKGGVARGGRLRIQESEQQFCDQKYADAHPTNQVNNLYTIVVLRDLVPSGPSIGLMVKIEDSDFFVLAQGVYGFKVVQDQVDTKYLIQLSNGLSYRKLMNNIMVGSTQVHITNTAFKNVRLPFPPLPEQHAIATALSDVDAVITSLDQLIAKKHDIKQATMQLLLTGKTRLLGFSGEWKVKSFEEMFQFLSTANNSRSDLSEYGEIKYIHYGDIHVKWRSFLDCDSDEVPFISKDKVSSVPLLEDGDLVMADASEDYGGVGISVEVKNATDKKVVAGLHTLLLRGDKTMVADGFKGYLQYIPTVKDALKKAATGISVYGISKNNVKNIAVHLPSIVEQQAIATVLSDMDAEIVALEQRRDKTRALKQGMMQELLTGKTRLL